MAPASALLPPPVGSPPRHAGVGAAGDGGMAFHRLAVSAAQESANESDRAKDGPSGESTFQRKENRWFPAGISVVSAGIAAGANSVVPECGRVVWVWAVIGLGASHVVPPLPTVAVGQRLAKGFTPGPQPPTAPFPMVTVARR